MVRLFTVPPQAVVRAVRFGTGSQLIVHSGWCRVQASPQVQRVGCRVSPGSVQRGRQPQRSDSRSERTAR
jgi:hypothetical protein